VTPIINPFGKIVANILEHTSVKWFCHRSSGTRDIVISVPTAPAVRSDCSSKWFWRSPLIHCPNHEALEPTCSWHPCTWSHKLVRLWNPRWPRYWGRSVATPAVQTAVTLFW
jgi:hypothetical protein